ncbi:B3 domain-containing protein Os03g0212300-like [Syzygium oleosum]|uniref:B3 domain-containing protein Os03g0212300-like n=1 Tax=Syzygium oleosum TaxID=219896 RepID=UPI0011D1918C|nr:B3 domain-containing protein Os03g0212300-like [Syzygium oleosum]XP_056177349.1 B3 domain-containing protein Os03g0212300-like [Syzygium oleosum]
MEGKRPSFFKFFMAEHSSERMKIPPAFLAYIKGKRPRAVSLTGPSGDSWTVGLIKEEGALYFDGGWPEFVEDHSVQTGDFLVFHYDGEAGFQVRVFDPTMSPREASFHAWNSLRVATELITSNGVMHVKGESDADGATGYSGTDHFCFQITMKSYNVKKAIFPIPSSFSEHHIRWQKDRADVVLCRQGGKQWPVWMFRRKDIRRRESWYLSRGLPAFIRDNRVKEGDTCAFELAGPSLLRVHISRA